MNVFLAIELSFLDPLVLKKRVFYIFFFVFNNVKTSRHFK